MNPNQPATDPVAPAAVVDDQSTNTSQPAFSPPVSSPSSGIPDPVVDGDVAAVPKETVGLGDDDAQSQSEDSQQPLEPEELQLPPEPEDPRSPPEPELNEVVVAGDEETQEDESDDGEEKTGESEKSPLEILEEILAGAEAEKSAKDEEENKKKAEEEAYQAEKAAKEAAYQVEATQRIEETTVLLEEAKQQRSATEQDLIQQGKILPTESTEADKFTIHQLEHKKTDE